MTTPKELAFYTVLAKGYLGVADDPTPESLEVIARQVAEWCKAGEADVPEADRAGKVLQGVLLLAPDEEQAIIRAAVAAVAGSRAEAAQQALTRLLGQVRASVKQACADPLDPSGRTISRRLAGMDAFLSVLPGRRARFTAGDRPTGVGDWVLDELLGVGGFGEVWKATHQTLRHERALKFCLDPTAAALLRHEGQLLARVQRDLANHAGIVRLHNTYLSVLTPCLEYDYVPGGTLAAYARQYPDGLPPAEVLRRLADLVEILAAVHGLTEPIVHRDLKPANILLEPDGQGDFRLRVADFGIAQVSAKLAVQQGTMGTAVQSQMSWLRGAHTPLYASPEQMKPNAPPDPSDDVHALGVIWYQLLVGDLSRPAPTGRRWQDGLRQRGVSDPVVALLEECFEPRGDRPASAVVLRARLRACAPPAPEPLPPRAIVVPALDPVRIEPVRAAQTPASSLPPLPDEILALEGDLAGLERAVEELTGGTHSSLVAGQAALRQVAEQVRQAETDLAAHEEAVPESVRASIRAAVAQGETSPTELSKLAGTEVPLDHLLPYLLRLRNATRARHSLASAQRQFDDQRAERVQALRAQAEKNLARLIQRQQADFEALLCDLFEQAGGDEFPLERWIAIKPHLPARRYRFVTADVVYLARAESFFRDGWPDERAWRLAQRAATPAAYAEYLSHFPKGRHAAEATAQVDDDARQRRAVDAHSDREAWEAAQHANTAEGYEAYLNRPGRLDHADQARGRAAGLLRAQVIARPSDVELRTRYLAVRTDELEKEDRKPRGYFDLLWPPLAMLALFVLVILGSRAVLTGELLLDWFTDWEAAAQGVTWGFRLLGVLAVVYVGLVLLALRDGNTAELEPREWPWIPVALLVTVGSGLFLGWFSAPLLHSDEVTARSVVLLLIEGVVFLGAAFGLAYLFSWLVALWRGADEPSECGTICIFLAGVITPTTAVLTATLLDEMRGPSWHGCVRAVALLVPYVVTATLLWEVRRRARSELERACGPLPWLLWLDRARVENKYLGE